MKATGSYLETSFEMWLKTEGITGYEREFTFTKGRKWRFDFAWREQRVAVEIDGLTNSGGSHQNIKGVLNDCEKYEAALAAGWVVYRVPGPWVATKRRNVWRGKTMLTLRKLLAKEEQ